MRNCKNVFLKLALPLFIIACENKSRQTEPVVYDNPSVLEQNTPNTISSIQEGTSKTATRTSTLSLSSLSHKSSSYDNLCGFDPASEDDMKDNGMSRYMKNNDEDG